MAGGRDVFDVVFRYDADTTRLQQGNRQAASSLGGVSKAGNKTSGALAALAPAAKAAGIAAAAAAAAWAVGGIKMAETAQAVGQSFDTTFGPAADDLTASLEATRMALGLSEGEMKRMAITMGQTATATGMSREEAAAFSGQMITMAGDVAAFNGDLSQAPEVLNAFQAAIRGEFDPLERFGIAIKQSTVNQKALEMTTKDSTDELTLQEKQAATLALIQEQLADETGALAGAMEDGSTAQNELNAQMKDNQTAVGAALMPIKAMGVELLTKLLPVIEALIPVLDLVVTLFDALLVLLSPIIDLIGWLVSGLADMVTWLVKGSGFLDRLKYGVETLRDAFWRLGNDIKRAFDRMNPFRNFRMPSFHSGGVVPGPTGSSTMAMLQGGERVIPAGAGGRMGGQGGGGAGTVINVTVNAGVGDPVAIGRELETVLGEYGRQKGGLDLPLTGV